MRFRNVMVTACLTAAAFVTPMLEPLAAQGSTGIVISEFRLRGATSINDEFIELFNSSTAPVAVGGWLIRASNSAGSTATRATIPAGVTINPGCFYLVANTTSSTTDPGYSGGVTPDRTYTTGLADGGGVAVTRADWTIVDQAGHSASGFVEGTPLPPLTTPGNRAFERRPGGTAGHADTNNNAADFQEISPANPQNASSTCLASTSPSVSGSASPSPVEQGQIVMLSATVSAGSVPPSTGLQVVGDLSAIGGSASQAFANNGVVFTTAVTVPVNNPIGPQSLALRVTDAQGRQGNTVLSLTINPPAVVYLPHEIQGAGATSPLANGTAVIVRGVVTARKSNGFFLQTEPGTEDADPATSEGVFVAGGAPPEAVVGHVAVVRGSVTELVSSGGSVTALNLVTAVTGLGAGTMPGPHPLTGTDVSANGTADQLERFEGMRVSASLTAITGTAGNKNEVTFTSPSDGTFFAVLTGQSRPFRGPGVEAGYPVLPCAFASCDVPTFDGNPERLRVDSDALEGTDAVDVSSGAVMTVTGPLDFGFSTYTLLPEATLTPVGGTTTVPAAAAAADQFTIASFNMDRFFDTVNDPGPDVVVTPQAFERRLAKASMAIRDVLKTPDVVGFQGVEKLQVLNDLATRIDMDAAVAGTPAPRYSAFLVEGSAQDGLDVGFLVKTAGGRVSVTSAVQVGAADTFVDPADPAVAHLVNDRPPLVLEAVIQGPATSLAQSLTVIANHLRSLDDVQLDDDTGRLVRAQRRAQAEFLATYINDRQLNDPSAALVSLGGYNAFGFNDGYVDTVGTILGTPAPADQVALASADLVTPDLVDLANFTAVSERYSSLSGGNAQALDHGIVTANLVAQFAAFVHPRVNADFADVQRGNASIPQRVSDSDPGVAYFYFPPDNVPPVFSATPEVQPVEATSAAGAVVTYAAPTATDNLDGDVNVACKPESGATQPLGNTGVTCEAADAAGNVASVSFTVTVADTTAPYLAVPADITAEAGSAAGQVVDFTASATDAVTASPLVTCAPAPGATFPIGVTTVACKASDTAGNATEKSFTVTVADTTAPQLTVPADITEQAGSTAGHVVSFTASASDAVTSTPVVTCAPASGTTFPVGVTLVECSASDAAGNSSSDAFAVTISAVIPGRMHGAGSVGSGVARVWFQMDVRQSASQVSGSLALKTSAGNFTAGVSEVSFADAAGFSAEAPRLVADSVTFVGSGSWNGRPGYVYQAVATDQGEPGRGRDTFTVVVRAPDGTVVASSAGALSSGNIQSLR